MNVAIRRLVQTAEYVGDKMQIKILFDSVALDDRFLSGWGVSYLIDNKILFDTGEKSSSLFRNIKTWI